jgi:hypothetical protein
MNFLAQTTKMVGEEADKRYNANVVLPFRLRYAKSQMLRQAGIQGEVDSINQNAAQWASIGNGLMGAGGAIMGMPEDAFSFKGRRNKTQQQSSPVMTSDNLPEFEVGYTG